MWVPEVVGYGKTSAAVPSEVQGAAYGYNHGPTGWTGAADPHSAGVDRNAASDHPEITGTD